MNPTDDNTGGYAASEMRKYLLNDKDLNGSTSRISFLKGLVNAGVPAEVMWAPKRYVSTKGAGSTLLEDLLWLPTGWELFGLEGSGLWEEAYETAANQAWLQYYDGNNSIAHRKKYRNGSDAVAGYWLGSPTDTDANDPLSFGYVTDTGGPAGHVSASNGAPGVAPAFCIQ
jgi:hypothetical protein